MRIVHTCKPATADARYSSQVVLDDELPLHEAVAQAHVLAVTQNLLPKWFNELSAPNPELDGEPVRSIDKVIVENGLAMYLRRHPVKNSSNIGTGVVVV